MLFSAVSVLVVAQSSSEIPEGLMNNPVVERHSSPDQKIFCDFAIALYGMKNPVYVECPTRHVLHVSCFSFTLLWVMSVLSGHHIRKNY